MSFQCTICGLFSHRADPQFNIFCSVHGCSKQFNSFSGYKSHVYRSHNHKGKSTSSEFNESMNGPTANKLSFKCTLCFQDKIPTLKKLISHLTSHIIDGISVVCPFRECKNEYNVASSFKSHVTRHHKQTFVIVEGLIDSEYSSILCPAVTNSYDDTEMVASSVSKIDEQTVDDVDDEQAVDDNEFQDIFLNTLSFSILKIQEMCYLPISTVDSILSEMSSLNEHTINSLQCSLTGILKELNIEADIMDKINECFLNNIFDQSIYHLKTNYLRNKYWKRQLRYVEPIRITLDRDDCHVKQSYEYIPLLESLKSLLSIEQVLTDIMNPLSQPNSDVLLDYSHGMYFKGNDLFAHKKNALQIILYFDEFEVVNPIGSKRGIHKISAVYMYFNLANIYPWHRSELKTIQLCILCPNKTLKNVGFSKILEPLLFDLKVLESEGIQVLNIPESFFGTVACVAGDNLGSHQIGGFTESFSSNVRCICRFCMASPEDIQTIFNPTCYELRNKANYDLHVQKTIESAPGSINLYGIKSNSVLNNLTYYHVTRGLPPDFMHDVFEGCARYEIPFILQKLEDNKYFSKNDLFRIMRTWRYGPNDITNKPPVPKSFSSIPASASQMWTLIRLLPLMIGNFVPKENKTFQILLLLKQISEIVCAPKVNINVVSYLDSLISDHLELFSSEFPEKRLIPKQHFLIHYPQHILNFGPLRSSWCMRFEAKHNYFKMLSHRLGNFTNICYTLASRHQRMQAYLTSSDDNYFKVDHIVSASSIVNVKTLLPEIRQALVQKNILDTEICQTSKIMISGVLYASGMYVVTDCVELEVLELSKILGIYLQRKHLNSVGVNAENVILVTELQKSRYDCHLGAFEMLNMNKINVCNLSELVDYYPLDEYIVTGMYTVTVLATYENSAKIVKLESKDTAIVHLKLKNIFEIPESVDIVIQKFNKDWDTYIDIEAPEEIENNSKIKIVCKKKVMSTSLLSNQNFVESTSDLVSIIPQRNYTRSGEDSLTGSGLGDDSIISSDHEEKTRSPKDTHWAEEKLDLSLLSTRLRERMIRAQPLDWCTRHELTECIQSHIFKYTFYPKPEEITMICRNLVQQFPNLIEHIGSGYDALRQRIVNKLKNARRPMDSPEILIKKRKTAHTPCSRKTFSSLQTKGIVNWSPSESFDENIAKESMDCDKNTEELQIEYRKIYGKDINKIKHLMNATFVQRRKLINSGATIVDILETYPALKMKEELSSEFERLMMSAIPIYPFAFEKKFIENLQKFSPATINLADAKKKKSGYLVSELCKLSEFKSESREIKDEHYCISSLNVLPELLGSRRDCFVVEYPETTSLEDICDGPVSPYIASIGNTHISNNFYVVAEKTILCYTNSYVKSVFILFISYYVYNMEYPKNAQAWFLYLQFCLFEILSKNKPPCKIITFFEKVKGHIMYLLTEVLDNIFSYINQKERLLSLQFVCKRFKNIVQSPLFWTEVDEEIIKSESGLKCVTLLRNMYIKRLSLSGRWMSSIYPGTLGIHLMLCDQLIELNVHSDHLSDLGFLRNLKKLKVLRLSYCPRINVNSLLRVLLSSTLNLKVLELCHCYTFTENDLLELTRIVKYLDLLDISFCSRISLQNIVTILDNSFIKCLKVTPSIFSSGSISFDALSEAYYDRVILIGHTTSWSNPFKLSFCG